MLCIQLNCLEPTAPASLLELAPNSQTLREYEGDRGGLHLLHVCAERSSLTKSIKHCSIRLQYLIDTERQSF